MSRPSYKELWLDERKDRDEQLQWIRDAVDGNAKFRNSEPPYSEEEELARQVMTMHTRIAELEKQSEHWHRLYQVKSDLLDGCERGFTPELEQLQKRIAELESKQRWIPVSERLPEVGKYVFLFMVSKTYGVGIGTGYVPKDKKYQWVVTQMPIPYDEITHWMPLPELPEANL